MTLLKSSCLTLLDSMLSLARSTNRVRHIVNRNLAIPMVSSLVFPNWPCVQLVEVLVEHIGDMGMILVSRNSDRLQ